MVDASDGFWVWSSRYRYLLGYAVDGYLGTSPWLTLVGAILGFTVGFLGLMRMTRTIARRAADD